MSTPQQTTIKTLRVAAYVRYSSHLQDDGYSIEAQRHAIAEDGAAWEREKHEAWATTWYEEPARSARHEKLHLRTRFAALLRDVEAGDYDLVVFHKLNRMARHLKDQLTCIGRIVEAGAGVHIVVERPDFTTPTGRLVANIMGSVAQYFVEDLGQEVRKGLGARARDAGLPLHRLPFGYVWPGEDRGDTSRAPELDLREEAGAGHGYLLLKGLLLAGYTQQEVADRLNAEGRWATGGTTRDAAGTPPSGRFTRETVRAIRANVFYRPFAPGDDHGTVRHGERTYRGAHLAACTWDEWAAMQQLARGRRHAWYRGSGAIGDETGDTEFRGFLVCAACAARGDRGVAYTRHAWSGRRRGEGSRHDYYRCHAVLRGETCPAEGHYARAGDVRAAWVAWMREHLRLPDAWQHTLRERAMAWARSGGASEGEQHQDVTKMVTARRTLWLEKRRRAIESYADLLLDRGERDRRVAEADAMLAALAREEEAQAGGGETAVARLVDAGRFVCELADDWGEMTPAERARAATLLLEARGLVVTLLGHGRETRGEPETCHIALVRLRPVFRELLATVADERIEVAG